MKQVPRSREAAQEHADLLARQVVVGWGKTHPIVVMADELAKTIKEANEAFVGE